MCKSKVECEQWTEALDEDDWDVVAIVAGCNLR